MTAVNTSARKQLVDRILRPFQKFAQVESASGVLLILCTLVALVWANSPWADRYNSLWQAKLTIEVGTFTLGKPLILFIRSSKVHYLRVLLMIFLAVVIFLAAVQPVSARPSAWQRFVRGRMLIPVVRYYPDSRGQNQTPELTVIPQAQSGSRVPFTYARVVQDDAPVYGHPGDVGQDLPPIRTLGVGYVWVSVQGKVTYEGEDFYQINAGEYVKAEALSFYRPSVFQGVVLGAQ